MPESFDPERPLAVGSATRPHPAPAAGLLACRGSGRVVHAAGGGATTWERLGLPLEAARPQTVAAD